MIAPGRGGFGSGMGAMWRQQQGALATLKEGRPNVRRTLARVWPLLRPYYGPLLAGAVIMLLGIGAGLVPPLLIREVLSTAIPHGNVRLAILLGAGMVLFPLGGAILSLGQTYLNAVVAQGIIADLRDRLYRHLQELGPDFYTWTRAGDIQSRFLNDAGGLQTVLTQSFLGTLGNVVTVVGTLAVMIALDWRLTLAAAAALPAFVLPVLWVGRRRYNAVEQAQSALGELSARLAETLSLSGALVVRLFGGEVREHQRFGAVNRQVRATQVTQVLVGQWLMVAVQGLAALGPALVYAYGAYLVITHQVALGTVVAFATYITRLYAPASSLAGANTTLLGGLALFDRIFTMLDLPVSTPEPADPVPLPAIPTGLAFVHVGFRYGTGPLVIHDLSFTAPVGTLTALVGPSGAGKSTLLSLAARLYDPTTGSVLLDGVDLHQVAGADLRRRLAVVTQDVFLFHASLRENLRYGAPDASETALEAAVDAAQLRSLIDRLPDGMDTVVGERGHRLSGGEKQRVAIARALLRAPLYLLLDEATSSLDSEVERQIQAALEILIQGRTVIASAHRLSTILRADQILVIDGGRIVEWGTHEELLRRSGLYQRLYTAQFAPETVAAAS
jgi:ATP-binding cassette subfamily B protein